MCLLRCVGLGDRARAGTWYADPRKTIKTVVVFLLDSDKGSVNVNCL